MPITEPTPQSEIKDSIASSTDFAQVGRGLLMGGADIIPGVSGGTVALILGIYERLVTAISHCDKTFFSHLAQRNLKAAATHIDLRFLIPLAMGIGIGVVALGTVMHTLLEDYTQITFAAFFGLIAASCILVARMIPKWSVRELALVVAGGVFAYWLVTQPALSQPPNALWYVFICGAVAICAMILPGISGAFILLIMGKYHDITGIIKSTLKLQITTQSLVTVVVFASGCLIGLITFSKFLRYLLRQHLGPTMALLCGFMIGSLRKLWPFQVDTTPEVEEFKDKVFDVIPFANIPWNGHTMVIAGTLLFSFLAVLLLDSYAQTDEPVLGKESPAPEEPPSLRN